MVLGLLYTTAGVELCSQHLPYDMMEAKEKKATNLSNSGGGRTSYVTEQKLILISRDRNGRGKRYLNAISSRGWSGLNSEIAVTAAIHLE